MRVAQQFGRDAPHQRILHGARRGARRDAGAIAEAEDVRIHRHRAFAERDIQHDVRGLAADARQLLQCLAIARYFAAVPLDQLARQLDDVAGLALPEADRADVLRHAIDAETHHRLGRRGFGEQRLGRAVDRHVGGLRRQHDGDQQREGIDEGQFAARIGVGLGQCFEESRAPPRASWRAVCGALPWRDGAFVGMAMLVARSCSGGKGVPTAQPRYNQWMSRRSHSVRGGDRAAPQPVAAWAAILMAVICLLSG